MAVVWMTTDMRYRFRIETAPLPLHRLTFTSIASVGILALVTDLWRAEGWLVPRGSLLTPAIWQALLGAVFLIPFLTWAWFAYMKPPTFGKSNAQRFGSFLYWTILDGSPTKMAVIAQELGRSVRSLVGHAPNQSRSGGYMPDEEPPKLTEVQGFANDILLLIADQRFCRTLVQSSPGIILEIFQEIANTQKYGVSISQFGRNVISAAIENPDSFMYHETEGYTSGLLGYHKPLSQAIFGNYRMAEQIGTLLDPDYKAMRKWSVVEWEAYNRAVLITLRSYVQNDFWSHSSILSSALDSLGNAASDLYKINGSDGGSWDHDTVQKLRASVDFCDEAIKILNEKGVPEGLHLRVRSGDPFHYETFYDQIADLMFEIIFTASSVKRPWDLCWTIQHNTVWGQFFGQLGEDGKAGKIVKLKLRRKIYDEIISATEWPNFKNIKILGFCLNVMGLEIHDGSYGRDSRALQKAVLAWAKQNFVSLEERSPQVFEDCLPAGLSYDKKNYRLIKTREIDAIRGDPEYFYFELDKPPKIKSTNQQRAKIERGHSA